MGNWQNLTLGDIGRGFARYRPFIAVVVAVVLIVTFLPGKQQADQTVAANKFGLKTTTSTVPGAQASGAVADAAGSTVDTATGTVTGPGSSAAKTTGKTPAGATPAAAAPSAAGNPAVPQSAGPDCDPATGRIRIPSRFAPPCKPIVTSNGGATSPGVTGDKITMVWYRPKADPAVEAALTAAGASDEKSNVDATVKVWNDVLNKHYNLYGRQIDMKMVDGTADAKDDAAGRSNAIELADKFHPFVVINAINNAFVDELVARKIICICTTSQPQEFYEARFPYAGWTTLMASTQGYIHRAEYVGKRLAGRKAKWAGYRDDALHPMSGEQRVFGLLWYNTPDGSYRSGAQFFERELARYGVTLKVSLAYPSDLTQAQEQTRPLISRLKAEGVTSVIFSGDPITPATFTSEANNQQWQPEWIITGSALTDTCLFARTYNQDQWSRAFGIAYLSLRLRDTTRGEAYHLHTWHMNGQAPAAHNTYGVLWAPFFVVGTGIHMAGPKLTPQTFAQGLFDYPVSGAGGVTGPTISYGRHGIWDKPPYNLVDLTQFDDVAEIWWDRTAQGPDEVGNNGLGMYRWVDGGKRYLPGTQPTSDPRVFDPTNSPTILDDPPPNEKPPEYEHKHYYGG